MLTTLKKFYTNNPWKGRLAISLLLIILLLGFTRIILTPSLIYGANSWMTKQGINSSIEDLKINIFDGTISLINAQGLQQGEPLFTIGLVEIHWQWEPLSTKTIDVTSIELDNLQLNIRQYDDSIIIGGVEIPLGKKPVDTTDENTATETQQEQPFAWAANLGQVTFRNLNICYLKHTQAQAQADMESLFVDYCVTLEKMSWQGSIGYATDNKLLQSDDIPVSTTGNFMLQQLRLADNKLSRNLLVAENSKLNNVIINGLNDIHIDQLSISRLSLLQRDSKSHVDAIDFKQLQVNDVRLESLDKLSIDSISIKRPRLYIVKQDDNNWEYQQWLPASNRSPTKNAAADKDTEKTASSALTINIKDFDLSDADMCYLQKDIDLYYCLTIGALDWAGAVNYLSNPAVAPQADIKINGALDLSTLQIKNHSISRKLLAIDNLSLAELSSNAVDDHSLAAIKIINLKALQRGEDDEDNTAAFDSLTINDIVFKNNNAAIDEIKLNGLSTAVSKNSDGQWEHAKWTTATSTEKPVDNDEKKSQVKSEKTAYAINKLILDSDKPQLFTDNSTQPATKVGLRKLLFKLDQLDSKAPEQDSQFNLAAQTLLHSTIDIEGNIRPFAEKISFEADGKLKGFDLRAATPAAKKAIGHKIQSGQMDADLTLKAVDGELDSNIALSLYHFRIKPESKKDADKLNEKFGMPLNQTLTLLRDKDDSIHLDIPITGDINNPNFDPMDAIVKATSKAATVTLITFYTPYGLIYAGGNIAFNLATALNFDPIIFTAGSAELQGSNKTDLDSLSKLLIEKPQVHLTLCGVTNRKDAQTLFPELEAPKEKESEPKLTKEQEIKLEQVARARQVNSKNYLIDEHGIAHERLILCAPEHNNEDDAIAGIEINI